MKICFVCSEYPPGPHGGIGTMTQVLARALSQAGHHVRVVGVYIPNHVAPPYEDDQGVQVWRLQEPAHRLGWVRGRYRLFRSVQRWSQQKQIDLVEVPDWQGWAAGWLRLPVPVVVRLNGSATFFAAELGRPVSRTTFLLERSSLRRAECWCSVSRYTAERTQRLLQLRSNPDAILPNPVETAPTDNRSFRSRNSVVFSGTLTAKKGIISLVKAWPRVVESCRRAELHVYGKDGRTATGQSMQAYLLSQANGVSTSMRFHGHVTRDKLFEALRAARVAVFPSYAEACAIAPLESMMHGCMTISSRRGSGPEFIEDGRSGLLVDPDRPDEIADAIIRGLTDDELACRLAEAGKALVRERFSLQTLLPENEAFYQRCIAAFAARTGAR